MIKVTPVIFCGGSGTRLWPLSRTGFPKQFLCLTTKESLFQQAVRRVAGLGNDSIQVAASLIVTGEDPCYLRPTEVETLLVDPGRAKEKLGWTPKITFEEQVDDMVRVDLKSAERDELVKRHGYKSMEYFE